MELRKSQRKRLMAKVGEYTKKVLLYKLDVDGWTGVEVEREYRFPVNRQSEVKNINKYPNGGLNPEILEELIKRGFMTVNGIINNVLLDDAEKKYLEIYRIYENQLLQEYGIKLMQKGEDPGQILKKIFEEKFSE